LITLSDERVAKLLVGHPVVVYVSDPFGFEYPDGGDALRGRVVDVRSGDDAPSSQEVRLEVTPFVSEEGAEVRRLVASRRHKLPAGIVEMLAAGERVEANLSYADEVPEEMRATGRVPKLVGGVLLSG